MSRESNGYSSLLSFLAGAAIGAGVALLFAPQSGKETRKKIKETSEKVVDEVKIAAENAIESVKSFVEGAKAGLKKEAKELKEDIETTARKK